MTSVRLRFRLSASFPSKLRAEPVIVQALVRRRGWFRHKAAYRARVIHWAQYQYKKRKHIKMRNASKAAWVKRKQKSGAPTIDKRAKDAERKLRSYGLTMAEYQALLKKQGHCCAICKALTARKHTARKYGHTDEFTWHVDHDHQSGKVRGLLCTRCNIALGLFRDSEDLLSVAIAYLKSFL